MIRVDTLSESTFVAALARSARFWGCNLSAPEKITDFPLLTSERFSKRMKEEPILDNGVVVGFKVAYVIPLSSLQPGMEVLVALDTSSGKNLVAAGMLVNDLFARE